MTHHLYQVTNKMVELRTSRNIATAMLNNFCRPILEVLMFPYLVLKKEIMVHFLPILEELVNYDKNIIEITSKHSTIYLLLISSSHEVSIFV